MRAALRQLQVLRQSIIIRLADKNMGIVVADKARYNNMCLAHLADSHKFTYLGERNHEGHIVWCKAELFELLAELRPLAGEAFGPAASRELHKYLLVERTYNLAVFYGLVKMHKPVPALRPITACHSWVTTPLAVVIARELHADMMRTFPHILADTKSLVRDIEALTFSLSEQSSLWLITGDVEGLYVNIPQETALTVLGAHLAAVLQRGADDGAAAALRAEWLNRAMRFVFLQMYMRFGDSVYHQVHGFPMGSPLSPDAANLFMALVEDLLGAWQHDGDSLAAHLPTAACLKLFRRLIDDYTVVLAGVNGRHVRTFLNEIDRRLAQVGLKVTWVVQSQSMDTLDLHVYRPPDMHSTGKLAFRTHAKLGNRYQYLHAASMHNPHVFPAMVRAELYRHAVNCSTHTWFWHMAQLFRARLEQRGHGTATIAAVFAEVSYSVRTRLLYGNSQPAAAASASAQPLRVFVKMPFDCITASMDLSRCMRSVVTDVARAWQGTPAAQRYGEHLERALLMMCWKRARTLGSCFMRSSDT